ncbi:OmpA family protein [Actinomadura sp. WMMA1423]|uniref:OmpA family protein n=1 Tax=Actinomadura sp. WMMA1423 TaxID=2591108 RepID=UPI00114634EF|nr:OmpA family protein [Actinomadura sp. WMMA1423]
MRTGRIVPALLLLPMVLAGCSGGGEERPKPYTGPIAKDAWSALGGGHSRIEMQQVERRGDRSVLRFYLTNPGTEPAHFSFGTAIGGSAYGNLHFMLVDPVGHKAYTPLYDGNGEGKTVGSDLFIMSAFPGARYETILAFPALPASLDRMTVVTPTSAGEFTGVPVVDGQGPVKPAAPVPDFFDRPAPGSRVAWPVRGLDGPAKGGAFDLYGITEGEVKSTTSSATEEKVGLRTDVLFDFDKATLSARAKAILDEVAAETRAKADPSKPPVLITGHTDGKGGHDYNMSLSRRRADAVLKELQARLGTAYQYRAEGKGEAEPVAKEGGLDDAQARQKNRRVEISYQIRRQATGTGATASGGPRANPGGDAGPPAPFRPDGPTVASRHASFGQGAGDKRRIDVKPFYRDGAYLVAVFDIVNLGPDGGPSELEGYSTSGGGPFGDFSVTDPATRLVYRGVRLGKDGGAYVDPGRAAFRHDPGAGNRGFFYVPAPPAGVRAVTFNAGPFGQIPNVPVR